MKRAHKLTWKRKGGGDLNLHSGKVIPPNVTFKAEESDIPKMFLDLVECLDPITAVLSKSKAKPVPKTKPKPVKKVYKMEQPSKGWWRVVEEGSGTVMHDQLLRKAQALQLKNSL